MEGVVVPAKLQVIRLAVAGPSQRIDQDEVLNALLGGDSLLDPVHTATAHLITVVELIVEFENLAAVLRCLPALQRSA